MTKKKKKSESFQVHAVVPEPSANTKPWFKTVTDTWRWKSKLVGNINIPDVNFHVPVTGTGKERYVDYAEAVRAETYHKAIELEAIAKLPISAFVTFAQAKEIFGNQTYSWNWVSRYRRGMLITFVVGNERLYLRRSVELYRDTKDGRFNIRRGLGKS